MPFWKFCKLNRAGTERSAGPGPARLAATFFSVIALILGILAPRAIAQVGLVPDPITTPDLKPIIDTIGLSDQQTVSLLPLHDAYKERYTQFQNTDVKKLMDQLVGIGLKFAQGKFEIPERKELEGIVSDFKRLLDKARSLDRGFFTEIGTLLSDDQMPRLDRARINRELKVYREILGGIAEMNRGAGANLAEMTRGLDLSPQEREQADLVLNEYEAALLSKSHDVYTVLTEAAKVVLDFIDESGIRGLTLEQIAAWGENPPENLMTRAQTVFDDASKPIQQAAWEVSQLNMRSFKRILPVLSENNQRELRDRYFRRAYREVYPHAPLWESRYRAALKLEGLTDEQRTAIESQRDGYRSQFDSAIDAGVSALEASRQYKTFRQFSHREPDPVEGKIEDAKQRSKSIDESAIAGLDSMLGETLVAQLDDKLKNDAQHQAEQQRNRYNAQTYDGDGGAGEASVEVAVSVDGAAIEGINARVEDESTRYLPQAMGVKSFQHTLDALAMIADDRDVAMTIFESYRTDYDALRSSEVKVQKSDDPAVAASQPGGDEPAADGSPAPATPTPTEAAKARASRQDELAAIDSRLFDDLGLLLHDDAGRRTLEMFRLTRHRSASAEVAKSMAQSFGDDEAYIDLVALVSASELTSDARAQVRTTLQEYDVRVAGDVKARLEAAREVQRRSDAMQRAGPRGADGREAMQFAMEKWRDARRTLRESNDKITAANREMLEQVASALTSDAAWQIKLAYNQAAYPEIFRDERGAEKVLQAAMELPDLADHQRDRINQVASQYRADFYGLCEQMVGLRKQRDIDFFGGRIPEKNDIDREIELEKMRFARNELSARAKLNLNLILTDEQAKVLPELQLQ